MATSAVCKIDGCGKPRLARGWCDMHYRRYRRRGHPEVRARCANGEVAAFVHDVVLRFEGDECLEWPFATLEDGYGVWGLDGRMSRAHRHICALAHGAPPSDRHQAAHSCGKGHLGCVNPRHLRWATPAENQHDRLAHGTAGRGSRCGTSKLSEADVRSIRQMAGKVSQTEIAVQFGVKQSTVSGIVRRRSWGWLSD